MKVMMCSEAFIGLLPICGNHKHGTMGMSALKWSEFVVCSS